MGTQIRTDRPQLCTDSSISQANADRKVPLTVRRGADAMRSLGHCARIGPPSNPICAHLTSSVMIRVLFPPGSADATEIMGRRLLLRQNAVVVTARVCKLYTVVFDIRAFHTSGQIEDDVLALAVVDEALGALAVL